jgi:cytochrome c553
MKTLLLICLLFSFPLHAEDLSRLYATLSQKQSNPALLQEAISKGKDRASFCKYCHGNTGNSKRGYIPNLASQNAKYLLYQFDLFATKQRKDKIMSELVGNLSNEDRINIALFYTNQKVKLKPAKQSDARKQGKAIFNRQCISCHGKKGHGKELLPRIAGQPAKYLNKTLRLYKSNSHRRPDSPMQAIATTLSDEELYAVVRYVSSMH